MFQKRMIEIFTLIAYWCVFAPFVYGIYVKKEIINPDWSFETFFSNIKVCGPLFLFLILGYIVTNRIVIFSYMKCKMFDIQMWHNIKRTQQDPEAFLPKPKQNNLKYSTISLDEPDGAPAKMKMIRTISNPLLVEDDLARIHIKHETRPLGASATLGKQHIRCAPAVPNTPPRTPGSARRMKSGVILTPDALQQPEPPKF